MRIIKNIKASVQQLIIDWLKGEESAVGVTNQPLTISQEVALKHSAVYGCVRVLGETLASCPCFLYQKTEDGRVIAKEHPLFDVVHSLPNDEMAAPNFYEAAENNINTGGYSVCQRLRNKKGQIVGLYPYPWSRVNIERKDGKLIYNVRGSDGTERPLARSEVLHVVGMSFDGITGMSPIEYMGRAIILGLQHEKFNYEFYRRGANVSGVVSLQGELSEPAFKRFKEDFKRNYSGLSNAGEPLFLEGGAKFDGLTMKPVDAQLLESRRFQVEDVARAYRVPLHLLQDLSRSTNNNIEHQSLEFVMYTMLPHFKRWEGAMNSQLLTTDERRQGYYFEFKMDALLRGDAKSRAEAYAAGRQWGWLSVNDIRKMENMPPIANGDIYLQAVNMVEAGKEPTEEQQTAQLVAEIKNMLERR